MSKRLASCSCGQLTAEVTGDPVRISICHCLACQRRTGSVFGEQARFPRENVSISGDSTEYVRVGDEGPGARFHFCPKCGSTDVVCVIAVGKCICRKSTDVSTYQSSTM